jgi:hypothetical protein
MELKKHLLTPGLKIEDVFKRVRVGVKNRTSRKPTPQIPWENSSLMGDFYFVPQTDGTVISTTSSQNTELVRPNDYNADEEAWNDIRNSSNPEDFITFIRHFGDSPLAETAKFKLDRLKKKQTDRVKRVNNLKLTSGDIYTGEMKNNRPNGQGTLIVGPGKWEGDIYEGQFKEGYFHGQGTLIMGPGKWEGDIYEGQFKEGYFHGQATYTHANGNIYKGQYKKGKRNGQGKFYYNDGTVYVGNFIDGRQNGQGMTIVGPGQWHRDKYEGQYKDGNFHGQGTYTGSDGTIYKGEYSNGKRTGYGIYIFNKGDRYKGEVRDSQFHGQGTYTFSDGRQNIGEYKKDKEWNAKHYNKYGNYTGSWVNGIYRNK